MALCFLNEAGRSSSTAGDTATTMTTLELRGKRPGAQRTKPCGRVYRSSQHRPIEYSSRSVVAEEDQIRRQGCGRPSRSVHPRAQVLLLPWVSTYYRGQAKQPTVSHCSPTSTSPRPGSRNQRNRLRGKAGDLTVRAEFRGEGCEISAVRGETDPYQGWVSVGELKMTPATVVIATCPPDLVESSWDITIEQ